MLMVMGMCWISSRTTGWRRLSPARITSLARASARAVPSRLAMRASRRWTATRGFCRQHKSVSKLSSSDGLVSNAVPSRVRWWGLEQGFERGVVAHAYELTLVQSVWDISPVPVHSTHASVYQAYLLLHSTCRV